MRRKSAGCLLFPLVLSFCGSACVTVSKDAGFGEVQRLAGPRVGHRLHWNRGAPGDVEVEQAVERLLREDLTVDAAVRIALLKNPSLQATYEELGIAQADVVEAGLLRNPVFSAFVRFPDRPPSQTNLDFDVVQGFMDALLLPLRTQLAEKQFQAVRLRVAHEVISLAGEVQKAYFEHLGATQVSRMRRLVTDAARASYEMALRLHQAGNLSDLNLSTEGGQYEQARVALARSESKVEASRERLTRVMGLWGRLTQWTIPDRLPDLPREEMALEHLESRAISDRLDLASAIQETEVLARALGITLQWRWLVTADLGVSAERDTDGQWVIGPSITVEAPIFHQQQGKIARQEAQLRQARSRVSALAVEIRSQVRALRDRLLRDRQLVKHYQEIVIPLKERIVALTQQEYNYMLTGVFTLILARQQEFDAYQEYIEAVQDYWITRAELQRVVGGSLPRATVAEGASSEQGEALPPEPDKAGPEKPSPAAARPFPGTAGAPVHMHP